MHDVCEGQHKKKKLCSYECESTHVGVQITEKSLRITGAKHTHTVDTRRTHKHTQTQMLADKHTHTHTYSVMVDNSDILHEC